MGVGSSKFLGLAVKDRSILAAEIHVSGDRRSVTRIAELTLAEGLSWDKPEALGPVLRSFLRRERFSASRTMVGVPARWLMASEKEIPPATPQVAADTLRLQAERLFSAEMKDLVFDYAGQSDPAQPCKVLLVAMQRQLLSRIETLADTAGLSLLAVTPTSLALRGAIRQFPEDSVSIVVEADASELILQDNGTPRLLRHLPVIGLAQGTADLPDTTAFLTALGNEVKRVSILMPVGATLPRSLAIWDGIGMHPSQVDTLAQRTGMKVRLNADLSLLGILSSNGTAQHSGRFGPAIALALTGAKPDLLTLDFLHSRLTPPKKHRIGHRTILAAFVTIAALVAAGFLVVDLQRNEAELADLKDRLIQMKPDIRDAESIAGRVSFARGWYETRPPFLQCLNEISAAFPEDGQIWAANFSIRDNRRGQLSGRTLDQRSVLAVLDRLKNNKKFVDVKLGDMRAAGGNRPEFSFSLNFTFIAVE